MSTRALAWMLGLGVLCCTVTANAAEPPEPACAPDVALRSLSLHYQGKPGVWFDAEVARCLLIEVERARELEALLADHEVKDGLQEGLLALTERQLTLAIQEADTAREGQQAAIRAQQATERQLRAPGRSRALWFAVGMVTSAALIGTGAYVLSVTR